MMPTKDNYIFFDAESVRDDSYLKKLKNIAVNFVYIPVFEIFFGPRFSEANSRMAPFQNLFILEKSLILAFF